MPRRVLQGVVVSNKNVNTLVIEVERQFPHSLLGKIVRRSKKYHADYREGTFSVGDRVRIEETAPISKLKRWKVIDKLEAASSVA